MLVNGKSQRVTIRYTFLNFCITLLSSHTAKFSKIAQTLWCGNAQELSGPSDQIPNLLIYLEITYNLKPSYSPSPSDFVARIWNREKDYIHLETELTVIY